MADPLDQLHSAIRSAADALGGDGAEIAPTLERPPKPEMGDYSTNAAMLVARVRGEPPRQVAESLRGRIAELLGAGAERVEVAGPGFVNVFLADRWHRESVAALLAAGPDFGRVTRSNPERVIVEFVSANPTGPLTVASGRGAAYGDSLARLLELTGSRVEREYLLNDVGGQVRRFAESIAARMQGAEPPEDGYRGEYVAELAAELAAEGADPADLDQLAIKGTAIMRGRIEATLDRFGVRFDTWFSERTLHDASKIEAAIAALRKRGHVYDSEGAVWLRTSELGDDKDRVLIRSDGEPTYFAADIAYHRDKLERGAERMIDPVGADHHGYVPRMRAAIGALGHDTDSYEAPIMQLVHLVEGGERARMSKRKGEFAVLDELVDDIGVDAARFFMLQRSHDTALDLDLDLARSKSQDNPVYYVQYAHARIASILRKAVEEGSAPARPGGALDGVDEDRLADAALDEAAMGAPAEASERALVKRLLDFPAEAAGAAERRAPHRMVAFATATAADFHAFYRDCQVVGAPGGVEGARLAVCLATKRVVSRNLDLLGVGAPDQM
ncbi:MAG: arginine--tRNA ligase [Solirubrobacterales bacterium]